MIKVGALTLRSFLPNSYGYFQKETISTTQNIVTKR